MMTLWYLWFQSRLRGWGEDHELGQGLAEYAFILSLIVVVAVLAVTGLGSNLSVRLQHVAKSLP